MESPPTQQAALQQLAAVPGVVGSMVFDPSGAVVASEFPAVFDPAGLRHLAAQLSADGYFREWMAGDQSTLELRYADGRVILRSLDRSWLLVLCIGQANAQLLSMALTQLVRRLRASSSASAGTRTGEVQLPPAAPAQAPSALDRLRAIATAELGEHASQALEILAVAGPKPKDLLRATSDIEKMTRLFISKKKAEEIGRRMRESLTG